MKTTAPMMRLVLTAVVVGAALTACSMLHKWVAIDSTCRGFPFWFVNVMPGDSYQNSAGQGTDNWGFRGYEPLIVDWLIWTVFSWVCLRLVKGTASALFAVAAIHCVVSSFDWWRYRDYFGWLDGVSIAFSVGIYILLGILAHRIPLTAALVGAGLYAVFTAIQAFRSVDMLLGNLIFKIPVISLLIIALFFALRRKVGRKISESGQQFPASRQTV